MARSYSYILAVKSIGRHFPMGFLKGILYGFLFVLLLLLVLKFWLFPKLFTGLTVRFAEKGRSVVSTTWLNTVLSGFVGYLGTQRGLQKFDNEWVKMVSPGQAPVVSSAVVSADGKSVNMPVTWTSGPAVDVLLGQSLTVQFDLKDLEGELLAISSGNDRSLVINKMSKLDFDITIILMDIRFAVMKVPLLGGVLRDAAMLLLLNQAPVKVT